MHSPSGNYIYVYINIKFFKVNWWVLKKWGQNIKHDINGTEDYIWLSRKAPRCEHFISTISLSLICHIRHGRSCGSIGIRGGSSLLLPSLVLWGRRTERESEVDVGIVVIKPRQIQPWQTDWIESVWCQMDLMKTGNRTDWLRRPNGIVKNHSLNLYVKSQRSGFSLSLAPP